MIAEHIIRAWRLDPDFDLTADADTCKEDCGGLTLTYDDGSQIWWNAGENTAYTLGDLS